MRIGEPFLRTGCGGCVLLSMQDLLLPDLYPEFFVGAPEDLPAVCR
eukprot:COSAG06_NODE_333_length_17341_cov_7.601032_28_plen_46_part_00